MTEEFGKEGPIRSIFLSEFHHIVGPKIVYQYPENYVSKEVFDAISVYIIPKPQILKRIITVNVLGVKVTGYPNEIKNFKYARNALIFNLCFVCDSTARTVHYEPAVKKLSEYLENLELENGFLSTEESREQMPGILQHILEELNDTGRCTVTITLSEPKPNLNENIERKTGEKGERRPSLYSERRHQLPEGKITYDGHERRLSLFSDQRQVDSIFRGIRKPSESETKIRRKSVDCSTTSVLHLKVVGIWPDPPRVLDHHVPVLISERVYSRGDHWDLTTQQVLPYIDGFSHIAKIAAAADVENNLVKACVENLLYYDQVQLLPIFQYSNIYTVTSGIQKLYEDRELQEECQRAVCKTFSSRPQQSHILMLYCSMTYGVTVRDLCIRFNPQALNIDERKLIQFGLQHELIRRLHCYPILLPSGDPHYTPTKHSVIHTMCNGGHSYDEICCKFGLTFKELNDKIERDPNILLLWK
ncbi:GATOR1 complex protein NPRL2 [Procambarus clarkii]|uniref:GATOR1 complex protein NPRL2 n=1 Tax=Procambarus clarkii TaxID=6728 RepID=UPI001E675F2D|nr:GATOR complex protein NPRL2-like [Procambarus clarkii]